MNLQSVVDLIVSAPEKAAGLNDMALVINFVFCVLILLLGARRWRKESVRAFILIGLGFTCFAVSHTFGLLGPANLQYLSQAVADAWKTPLVWIRGLGYVLVIIGLLS